RQRRVVVDRRRALDEELLLDVGHGEILDEAHRGPERLAERVVGERDDGQRRGVGGGAPGGEREDEGERGDAHPHVYELPARFPPTSVLQAPRPRRRRASARSPASAASPWAIAPGSGTATSRSCGAGSMPSKSPSRSVSSSVGSEPARNSSTRSRPSASSSESAPWPRPPKYQRS